MSSASLDESSKSHNTSSSSRAVDSEDGRGPGAFPVLLAIVVVVADWEEHKGSIPIGVKRMVIPDSELRLLWENGGREGQESCEQSSGKDDCESEGSERHVQPPDVDDKISEMGTRMVSFDKVSMRESVIFVTATTQELD